MTPDMIAQGLCAVMTVAAVIYREPLFRFLADCSDGNVCRLEREEQRADEARNVLAKMGNRRWV
jgi:hypothetical protein